MGLSGSGSGLTLEILKYDINNPTNGQSLVFQNGYWVNASAGGGGGAGTVTSVSVVSANGFSGTVANPTTTPAITLRASALNASTIGSGTVNNTEYGYLDGVTSPIQSQISAKQDQGPYITGVSGDGTAAGPGSVSFTLSTVNAAVGTFGSAATVPSFTVNAKGLITSASNVPISILSTQISDAGSVGRQILRSTTTAAATDSLGSGSVGVQIFQATTTAAVQAIIDASAKQNIIQFQDEGVNLSTAGGISTVNFTGGSVTASATSTTLTVRVSAAGAGGSVNASGVVVDDSGFVAYTGADAQTVFDKIEEMQRTGNNSDPLGWSLLSSDFLLGTSLTTQIPLTNNSSGTSAASTISNNTLTSHMFNGFINATTGTTGTGHASVITTMISSTNYDDGDMLYVGSLVGVQNAPTAGEDFDIIGGWLSSDNSATADETLTTQFNVYLLASRTYANWQFSYVDNTNTRVLVDTGVAVDLTMGTWTEILYIHNSIDASKRAIGRINNVEVADVTGLRGFAASPIIRPLRIEKLAGTTARVAYCDMQTIGWYSALARIST